MPRPRFERLTATKRLRILEAAARQFAAHGFEDASLNQILQDASISKGAAYYYFDDKADLFATTVATYAAELLTITEVPLSEMTVDNFWSLLASGYESQVSHFADRPWAFGAIKAAWRAPAGTVEDHPALQKLVDEIHNRLGAILRQGQALGVIRSDLPLDLLTGLFIAIDDASDRWLLANWANMETDSLQETVRRVLQGLARFMAPPPQESEA